MSERNSVVRIFAQRAAVLSLGLGLAASSFSATPLSGMWSFDGELTGKPGRGFQIDSQGSALLIISYFGYRTDGSALFLQAHGPREDNGDFSADLVEYQGGTVLGGPNRMASKRRSLVVCKPHSTRPRRGPSRCPVSNRGV